MLVKFVKLILTIPGLLKYFEIVIFVITEEPLKEKALDFENLVSKFTNVFIVTKEICSPIRSPGSQRRVIFQSFNLIQDVKEKNLMLVTFVATNVLQDHTNIHTGENHMCAKFVVMQDINVIKEVV